MSSAANSNRSSIFSDHPCRSTAAASQQAEEDGGGQILERMTETTGCTSRLQVAGPLSVVSGDREVVQRPATCRRPRRRWLRHDRRSSQGHADPVSNLWQEPADRIDACCSACRYLRWCHLGRVWWRRKTWWPDLDRATNDGSRFEYACPAVVHGRRLGLQTVVAHRWYLDAAIRAA
jgi:hypothetical protein